MWLWAGRLEGLTSDVNSDTEELVRAWVHGHQPSRMGLPFVPAAGLPDWPPGCCCTCYYVQTELLDCMRFLARDADNAVRCYDQVSHPASSRPAGALLLGMHACMGPPQRPLSYCCCSRHSGGHELVAG